MQGNLWTVGVLLAMSLQAQSLSTFTFSATLPDKPAIPRWVSTAVGSGVEERAGAVSARLVWEQAVGVNGKGSGPGRATLTLAQSAQDLLEASFDFAAPGSDGRWQGAGIVAGGRGKWSGLTGPMRIEVVPEAGEWTATLRGELVRSGERVAWNLPRLELRLALEERETSAESLVPAVSRELGNLTLITSSKTSAEGAVHVMQTLRSSPKDQMMLYFSYSGDAPVSGTGEIWGGTGVWEGASGTVSWQLSLLAGGGLGQTVTGRWSAAVGAPRIGNLNLPGARVRLRRIAGLRFRVRNWCPRTRQ